MMTLIKKIFTSGFLAYLLFWSWNLIFVTFMALGFAPLFLPDLLTGVIAGVVPSVFLVIGVVVTLIPIASIVLALTVLRKSPSRLFTFAYGVELTLMFILLFRFFILRDPASAVGLVITIALIGIATLLWQVLDVNIDARPMLLQVARAIGLTLLLLAYLYGSVWIAFYAVPIGALLVRGVSFFLGNFVQLFTSFNWYAFLTGGFFTIVFGVFGGMLSGFTATLLVITPIAVPIIAIRAWLRGIRALIALIGPIPSYALSAAVVVVCALLAVATNQQPQAAAFALLKTPPATVAEARQIAQQENAIRAGLLNTYLSQFRYLSAVGQVYHIKEGYQSAVGLPEAQAESVQQLYEAVARPLLYEPINAQKPNDRLEGRALREEPNEAAKLYKQYFDARINDGEHDPIANTVRSTWSVDQAAAALQAVDDAEILLARQELNVIEHGDWADIELFEVYQNQSTQRQEVVYYFSLPESAVVTGLWLNSSDDRATRSAYRVAPRGAAQQVYRNEVRRNVDPALVEQIGPRQYRLRVFPIEPRPWQRSGNGFSSKPGDAPKMYMWLTFRVLAHDGAWEMPRLSEKRNVYWNGATARFFNGHVYHDDVDEWMPPSIKSSRLVTAVAHRVEFPSGETVIARPMSANELPQLPGNLRVAIVLDRSRSMTKYSKEVQATLARLAQLGDTDTYLTSSAYRGEPASLVKLASLDTTRIEYLGGQNAGELLAQFDKLRATGATYDAIFVVTDGSGYELGDSGLKIAVPNAPVWMVHLGGALPLGYDDATLEAIQASRGGVTTSVEDALHRLAVGMNRNALAASDIPSGATADWVDGYAWYVFSNTPAATAPSDDFAPLAARRLILDSMYRQRANLRALSTLDALHAVAIKQSIVTPFSSMLVLVNTRQEQMLKELEGQADRFDREVEEVGDTLPQNNLSVTAVPEPHEWLLIALAAGMLVWYVRREKSRRMKAEV